MMLALKPPHRPLSAVTSTSRMRSPSRCSSRGCAVSSARAAMLERTSIIFRAYGRAANIASWARRSFAAETIFMALVICCVFLTERIRRRRSIRLGIGLALAAREALLEFLDCRLQPGFGCVVDVFLFANGGEQLRMGVFHEA